MYLLIYILTHLSTRLHNVYFIYLILFILSNQFIYLFDNFQFCVTA